MAACGSSDDDSSSDATATTESGSDSTEPAETTATTEAADTEPPPTTTAASDTEPSPATTEAADTEPPPTTTAASDTEPSPATTQADDTASTGDETPGSPVVPASSVDLAAIPPGTAIAIIGDDALVYSVIGPGVRKCLAVLDQIIVEGRFVDESGEVMKSGNFDIGTFTLRNDDADAELGLVVGDGINERAWGAGSSSVQGIDVRGGQINEIEVINEVAVSGNVIKGSATMVDLLSGDGSTVEAEFGVNCG